MGLKILSLTLILMTLISVRVVAGDEFLHPGYLDDVRDERFQTTKEIIITPLDEATHGPTVNPIFTEKMTKEFSHEFRLRFGYTEFEQLQFTSNRIIESSDSGRQIQFDEYLEKQEKFGQYIAKELAEYHVDSYLKGHRSTRGIYKTKQAISNIQVQTAGGYKVAIRYKFTTNRVSVAAKKPGEKFHKSIDSKLDGDEVTAHLAYDLTKTVVVGSDWDVTNDVLSLRGEKRLTETLSTSITGQSFSRDVGNTPKQDRILLGLRWND